MFTSARKTLPAIDYVSIVRSVYGDRRAMLFGALASALAAGISAFKTQSVSLVLVAFALLVVGLIRFANMQAFWRADIGNEDAAAAEHWENRALIGGGLVALTHGIWCMVSVLVVRDPFAELASCTISIAATVGMVARNFGLDRLITIQTLLFSLPLAFAMFVRDDVYHPLLAALLVVMLVSFRKLAADVRAILLSAVHGRVDASRLAAELDIALTTMNHGVVMLDDAGMVTVVNDRAADMFGRMNVDASTGRSFAQLIASLREEGQLPQTATERLTDLVDGRGSGKVLLCLPAGRYLEVTVSSRQGHSVLLFEDISDRIAAEERISFMARHDELTGLANRSFFTELVTEDLAERRATAPPGGPGRQVALLMIDIDDFKHVNDTMGHAVGDALLKEAARRLRGAMGPHCLLARLGGDEFVVFIPELGEPAVAEAGAEAILEAFAAPFDLGDVSPLVGTSIGVVVSALPEDDFDALLAKADLALYAAKAEGKRKARVFHADMDMDYQYRQRLKFDLAEAVARRGLSLAYQPQVDLATGKVVACEALARWSHPGFGTIPPSVFIPLAEEMGLVGSITAWVLEEATRECAGWPGGISVAVNVSGRDFRSANIGAIVARALQKSGLPASRLELEVTETAVIDQRETAIAMLKDLAAQGIAIALDDFGTGYSSLSYLQALPFTKLKIDRSFVDNITSDRRALMLLANVARLGTELDMCVIAEGVETEAQLEAIRTHTRVQQVQGYLLSRPLPARDIGELIGRLNGTARRAGQNRTMVNTR